LTVKARLAELFRPPEETGKPPRRETAAFLQGPAPGGPVLSVNLIGKTVDEAEAIIEKEIDRALLSGQSGLTIIHGLGTGRLRHGVLSLLKRHPLVKGYHSPADAPGGSGMTEVELLDD
jgi:DNA mismatch repair protein MutS2